MIYRSYWQKPIKMKKRATDDVRRDVKHTEDILKIQGIPAFVLPNIIYAKDAMSYVSVIFQKEIKWDRKRQKNVQQRNHWISTHTGDKMASLVIGYITCELNNNFATFSLKIPN